MPEIFGAHNVHGDQINQTGDFAIGKEVTYAPPAEPKTRRTVLMLLSNPIDTHRLRLDEEHRAISQAIRTARHRDQIRLEVAMAPRDRDLHNLYHRYRPTVVHYAGHGDRSGIALLDDDSRARAVPPAELERLFHLMRESVECVVLNACLTSDQAMAIARHVPCVVGLARAVQDPVAIRFAEAFYAALANGESVARAFRFGCHLPALRGLSAEGPQLFSTPGTAERLRITS